MKEHFELHVPLAPEGAYGSGFAPSFHAQVQSGKDGDLYIYRMLMSAGDKAILADKLTPVPLRDGESLEQGIARLKETMEAVEMPAMQEVGRVAGAYAAIKQSPVNVNFAAQCFKAGAKAFLNFGDTAYEMLDADIAQDEKPHVAMIVDERVLFNRLRGAAGKFAAEQAEPDVLVQDASLPVVDDLEQGIEKLKKRAERIEEFLLERLHGGTQQGEYDTGNDFEATRRGAAAGAVQRVTNSYQQLTNELDNAWFELAVAKRNGDEVTLSPRRAAVLDAMLEDTRRAGSNLLETLQDVSLEAGFENVAGMIGEGYERKGVLRDGLDKMASALVALLKAPEASLALANGMEGFKPEPDAEALAKDAARQVAEQAAKEVAGEVAREALAALKQPEVTQTDTVLVEKPVKLRVQMGTDATDADRVFAELAVYVNDAQVAVMRQELTDAGDGRLNSAREIEGMAMQNPGMLLMGMAMGAVQGGVFEQKNTLKGDFDRTALAAQLRSGWEDGFADTLTISTRQALTHVMIKGGAEVGEELLAVSALPVVGKQLNAMDLMKPEHARVGTPAEILEQVYSVAQEYGLQMDGIEQTVVGMNLRANTVKGNMLREVLAIKRDHAGDERVAGDYERAEAAVEGVRQAVGDMTASMMAAWTEEARALRAGGAVGAKERYYMVERFEEPATALKAALEHLGEVAAQIKETYGRETPLPVREAVDGTESLMAEAAGVVEVFKSGRSALHVGHGLHGYQRGREIE